MADERRRWLSVLARTPEATLESMWGHLPEQPGYRSLRHPEIGMVLVRGRASATGRRFNLGEATVTRCTVQLSDGTLGVGYVAGRKPRHAELVAAFDALFQDADWRAAEGGRLLALLEAEQQRERAAVADKVAATRVEFFTMVRGDD
jgi:alpha-D-ribose 1-methylphosphonate 5-triphosphate synthase subunit PhnG